jgi:hypothetical protein
MKISESLPSFTSVVLTFTFESQRELDLLGSLMNCAMVHDALKELEFDTEPTYNALRTAGANIGAYPSRITELLKKYSK